MHGLLAAILLVFGFWLTIHYFHAFQVAFISTPTGKEQDVWVYLPLGLSILGGFAILHGLLNVIAMFCIFLQRGLDFLIVNASMNFLIFPIGTYLGWQFMHFARPKKVTKVPLLEPDSLPDP